MGWYISLYKRSPFWTIVLTLVLVVLIVYLIKKILEGKGSRIEVPAGQSIPSGWDPNADAMAINAALEYTWYSPETWGDDTDTLWNILVNKNDAQLALIYNAYFSLYKEDLIERFSNDLSQEDSQRAIGYFQNLQTGTAPATPGQNTAKIAIYFGIAAVIITIIIIIIKRAKK
jgi:hypothetical protein